MINHSYFLESTAPNIIAILKPGNQWLCHTTKQHCFSEDIGRKMIQSTLSHHFCLITSVLWLLYWTYGGCNCGQYAWQKNLVSGDLYIFWTQWTVSRVAKRLSTSSFSSQYIILATDSRASTTKIWLRHFQLSGQPDVKTTQALILQLEEEYYQWYSIFVWLSNHNNICWIITLWSWKLKVICLLTYCHSMIISVD